MRADRQKDCNMNATPETIKAEIKKLHKQRKKAQAQPVVDVWLITELTRKIADAYGDLLAISKSGVTL